MASVSGRKGENRFEVLCYEQVNRLSEVMEEFVSVHGRGNFPTLQVKLSELMKIVKQNLSADGINVKNIRINGGAASYILGVESPMQSFNDLDLIFGVDIHGHSDYNKIKNAVLNSLLEFFPEDVSRDKMNTCNMKDAYVQKMVKVFNDNDRWSLISLLNYKGKNIELKFVHKMKRQFEFSVDSFQIVLDSLLTFYDVTDKKMSEHFYPTVVAESVYGDFTEALYHLNKKLIATKQPEQIRGGGLLKYCNLLVHDYIPAKDIDIKSLEKYMCSRFFIDFPILYQQRIKLEKYLADHFAEEDHMKYDYLMTLYSVVDESTICLMNHERHQTLDLIQEFASHIIFLEDQRAFQKQLAIQKFDNQNLQSSKNRQNFQPAKGGCLDQQSNLIIDKVYYHSPYVSSYPFQCSECDHQCEQNYYDQCYRLCERDYTMSVIPECQKCLPTL